MSARLRSALSPGARLETPLRFARFCTVGASGVVVNQLLLWLGREYLFAAVSPPRLRLNAALALAIAVATLNNFLWNRFWTWRDRHHGAGAGVLAGQFGQYTLAVLLGIAVQAVLTNLLSSYMHYLLANLVAIGAAAGVNFALNNAWTFRSRTAPTAEPAMMGRMSEAWLIGAVLLAALAYFYGLDSWGIPSNGDEYAYAHIARRTAESGHWLPLVSDMANLRNTKPPLLFWQGIVSTDWGRAWTLWRLRLPSVLYTLASAVLALVVVRRLTRSWERGASAAIVYLGCYAVYRYGRPFLTDPPEVFWLSVPLAALLWTRGALLESRLWAPLAMGIALGIAGLYKSFVLILPVALVILGWYLERRRSLPAAVKAAAPAVAVVALVALALFAIWPLLDPEPGAIWHEFVLGENAGKVDTAGGYLRTLVWGGFSVPALIGGLFLNGGLLAPLLLALAIDGWRHRRELSPEERWLWIWVLGFLIAFALPSQRSARYLLPVMPALAMLAALAWQRLPRLAFMASAALALVVGALFAFVSVLIARDTQLQLELPWAHWAVLAAALGLAATALMVPRLAPATAPVSVLLLLLLMGIALRTFDAPPGPYPAATRARLRGEAVFVPCNFSASEEGLRFLLPGADVRSYAEDDAVTPAALAPRYRFFAAYVPLGAVAACEGCRVLGERYVVRGRRAAALASDLNAAAAVRDLLQREVLFESTRAPSLVPPAPEACAREARHAP